MTRTRTGEIYDQANFEEAKSKLELARNVAIGLVLITATLTFLAVAGAPIFGFLLGANIAAVKLLSLQFVVAGLATSFLSSAAMFNWFSKMHRLSKLQNLNDLVF